MEDERRQSNVQAVVIEMKTKQEMMIKAVEKIDSKIESQGKQLEIQNTNTQLLIQNLQANEKIQEGLHKMVEAHELWIRDKDSKINLLTRLAGFIGFTNIISIGGIIYLFFNRH